MKIRELVLLYILIILVGNYLFGCAGQIRVADKIQVAEKIADEIKIAEVIKIADEINPEIKLVAGVDKSVNTETKQSAGRDAISGSGNINDSDLMKFIFGKVMDKLAWIIGSIFAFLLSLFGGIWGMLKYQSMMYNKLLEAKQKWIENLIKSNSEKDNEMDNWMRSKINGGGK